MKPAAQLKVKQPVAAKPATKPAVKKQEESSSDDDSSEEDETPAKKLARKKPAGESSCQI